MDNEQDSKKIDAIDKLSLNDLTVGEKFYFIKEGNISSEGQIVTKYDNCFAVSIFSGQTNYKPVTVNEQVNFIIANKSSAFNCSAQVLQCTLEDGFQLAVLTIPTITNKIERRVHARVEIVMPVYYFNLPSFTQYNYINEVPKTYFDEMKKTFTVDISNNGIKIITYKEKNYSKNAIISLDIGERIDILASVVRIDFDKINKTYKTAFEFKDLDKDKWEVLKNFLIKH